MGIACKSPYTSWVSSMKPSCVKGIASVNQYPALPRMQKGLVSKQEGMETFYLSTFNIMTCKQLFNRNIVY